MSNVRLIVSHQPSKAPLLFTANFAVEWYDTVPTGLKQGRLRDVQAAAQVDRRLGNIPNLGTATLTLAYYYQWMKDNALITIPAGNTAPGTGIVLPGAASTLLATKGNIDIFQAKVTVPIKGGTGKGADLIHLVEPDGAHQRKRKARPDRADVGSRFDLPEGRNPIWRELAASESRRIR
jgi:hypothetical protein